MNEKIRELAKEHGFVHDFMTVGEYNDALQKFEKIAEVIVKECALSVSHIQTARIPNGEYVIPSQMIRKHFGVGE